MDPLSSIRWLSFEQHRRAHRPAVDQVEHQVRPLGPPAQLKPANADGAEAVRLQYAPALVRIAKPHQRRCRRQMHIGRTMGGNRIRDDPHQLVVHGPLGEGVSPTGAQHPKGFCDCGIWSLQMH